VGDWVLAIGSPFGLSQTVSAGIVSAKDRSIDDRDETTGRVNQFQKFIQTDAAINPGNSGGPLVDMTGAVIGMNTAIYTQSMGSQGVGFAMPSNILAKVYNDLIGPTHKVIRGSIGIQFQAQQNSAVSRMYGFSNGGVIVGSVVPNAGAAKAGLKPGDILVSIDGRHIKNGDDLVDDISARKVGTSVTIGFLRDGKQMTASVQIGDRAKIYADLAGGQQPQEDQPAPPDAGQTKLGISVTAIPPSVASKLSIPGGVTITAVTPGSFGDDIGLGQGDIVTEINKQKVTDMVSYNRIVSQLKPGDDVVFVVRIKGQAGDTFIGGTLR
jgi:serine protease Do